MKTLPSLCETKKFAMLTFLSIIALGFGNDPTWVAPSDAAKAANPVSQDPVNIAAGKKIFSLQCVSCHGDKGKGDGIAAVGLTMRPANFTDPAIVNETDGSLFWKITTGKKPMPSFKTKLTDQQRWEAVLYIRQLQKTK